VAKIWKKILKVRVDPERRELVILQAERRKRRKPRLIIVCGKPTR